MIKIKRILIVAIIFIMCLVPTTFAEHYTPEHKPEFYGNVYMFDKDPTFLWSFMNIDLPEGSWLELQVKSVALVNKGEVMNIRITAPYSHSMIKIYYKERIYYFRLEPYMVGKNFLLFTFTGG